jgi:hypothetical protein
MRDRFGIELPAVVLKSNAFRPRRPNFYNSLYETVF